MDIVRIFLVLVFIWGIFCFLAIGFISVWNKDAEKDWFMLILGIVGFPGMIVAFVLKKIINKEGVEMGLFNSNSADKQFRKNAEFLLDIGTKILNGNDDEDPKLAFMEIELDWQPKDMQIFLPTISLSINNTDLLWRVAHFSSSLHEQLMIKCRLRQQGVDDQSLQNFLEFEYMTSTGTRVDDFHDSINFIYIFPEEISLTKTKKWLANLFENNYQGKVWYRFESDTKVVIFKKNTFID